jgi:hypothetical protein
MGKDQIGLLPPHLDLHLEVFVPNKKKKIATQKLTCRFHSLMPTKMMKNLHLTHAWRREYLLKYHGKGLANKTMKILIEKNQSLKFHLTLIFSSCN